MTTATAIPIPSRAAVEAAIIAMGELAERKVALGAIAHFGAWLGWPDWMRDGTSHASGHGPLPPELLVRDDLIVVANLVDHVDMIDMVEAAIRSGQLVGSNVGRLAFSCGPTLGECFGLLGNTLKLGSPYLTSRLDIVGETATATLSAKWPLGKVEDFASLCWIAHCYQTMAANRPLELSQVEVSVTLPASPRLKQLEAVFGCPISPGAPRSETRFPAAWLGSTNPSHDPMIWALTKERIDLGMRKWNEADHVSQTRALVIALLDREGRPPRLKEVASASGKSPRTLVRMLHSGGSSFHAIVEDERRVRVLKLMSNSSLSLSEVADAAGFPDASSFGRKFRSWFGQSPARFRQATAEKA
jgi:AraC-like DNA-binding protein